MCLDAGASSVLVLDHTLRSAELCLQQSGIKEACEFTPKARAAVLADKKFYQKVDVPKGMDLKSTMVMKRVLEADVLIAAPVAKSHSDTGVSLSMKGMMGLIYNRWEMHKQMDLDTAIVDLCTVLPATLTVIDATRILSTGGPGGPGKVITLNKVHRLHGHGGRRCHGGGTGDLVRSKIRGQSGEAHSPGPSARTGKHEYR